MTAADHYWAQIAADTKRVEDAIRARRLAHLDNPTAENVANVNADLNLMVTS